MLDMDMIKMLQVEGKSHMYHSSKYTGMPKNVMITVESKVKTSDEYRTIKK